MNIFLVISFVVAAIIVVAFVILKKKKKNIVMLGREMAAASAKEKQRIERGDFALSPLPGYDYSKWKGEQSLINPNENELDLAIIKLCKDYISSDDAERKQIRRSITQSNIYTLMEFVKRSVIWSIRNKESSYLYNGAIAVSMIETERCDYRDVWVTMGFLNHGIQKMKLDSPAILGEAIQFSEPNTRKIIEAFSGEKSRDIDIESLAGYTEIETPHGSGFVGTGYEEYHPKKNLCQILLNISEFISRDKYEKGDITIREKIPSYCLDAEKNSRIEKTISTASGCAYLASDLRDNFSDHANVQLLMIILSEFDDNENLKILVEQSNNVMPKSFKRLCFTEGNILCLVIQRATMVGVEDFETNETLKRFEAPLREMIIKG